MSGSSSKGSLKIFNVLTVMELIVMVRWWFLLGANSLHELADAVVTLLFFVDHRTRAVLLDNSNALTMNV